MEESVLYPKIKKLTLKQQILSKSEMYIGYKKQIENTLWVVKTNKKNEDFFEKENVKYSPGLLKIFDEIITNSQDAFLRTKKVTFIEIKIDLEKNNIIVMNDGVGIEISLFENTNIYIPTVIFGEFLSSGNYNEEEDRKTAGNFGYGAKLTNLFSLYFSVETFNKDKSLYFKQKWYNNMDSSSEPIIKKKKGKIEYTKISFIPDLEKFYTKNLNEDILKLIKKRIYDVAGTTNIKVILDEKLIYFKTFLNYIEKYLYNKNVDIIYDSCENYNYGVVIEKNIKTQISFVNGTNTILGGKHVDLFFNNLIKIIKPILEKKNKSEINITPSKIKNNIMLFLNCNISNPMFNSQMKEQLIEIPKEPLIISEKFIKKILNSELISIILNDIQNIEDKKLVKQSGKKINKLYIPKLEDANNAGTKKSINCTLIITEGDSAKSLAVSGLSIIGRDNYGVFPLKGKLLNVREATKAQILKNEEINNIIKIIGLEINKKYKDKSSLRYGKIMLMTDQDQDGSHIKGLFINFIHYFWPELLKLNFLQQFITPIIKATKDKTILSFYNVKDYENWVLNDLSSKKYFIKYYKGLGTSTSKEAKEYFKDLNKHLYDFIFISNNDFENIKLAFDSNYISERKKWLRTFMEKNNILSNDNILYNRDDKNKQITYSDFINKELIHYSNADNIRSIPSIVDGLKPSQRKILYVMFILPDKEIKVEQLSGIISSKTSYHHGEQSLKLSIINLAHDYVGSNNINLLEPIGQFGTRLNGGKDAASPRYIFTKLSEITKYIYIKQDEEILDYLVEEKQIIEPKFYVPIIPMCLVNGETGIGTGWSTNFPMFNPLDIIKDLKNMLINNVNSINDYKPWYKNFTGQIIKLDSNKFEVYGKIYINENTKEIYITELPINTWTDVFKETRLITNIYLEKLISGDVNLKNVLSYKEYSTENNVYIIIKLHDELFDFLNKKKLIIKSFKMCTLINTNNLMAFNENNVLKLYKNVNEIINEFYNIRLKYYDIRKNYLINLKEKEIKILSNQIKFILNICENKITIQKKTKDEIIKILNENNFDSDIRNNNENDFDYLIQMPIYNLSLTKIDQLTEKKNKETIYLNNLINTTIKDMWLNELNELLIKYNEIIKKEKEEKNKFLPSLKGFIELI